MTRPMRIMLICVGILFGSIILYKLFSAFMLKRYLASHKDVVSVSVMKVSYADWQPTLVASASLRAIRGVNITTELAGMVQTIYFTPGTDVIQNTPLVQLNADTELGQLQSLQAQVKIALITFNRDKAQYAVKAVSKQQVDSDEYNLKNLQAQVIAQSATVAKKTLRAPFSGRLGINKINPGQYINPGDAVVMLQTLDPIYADFYIPQQSIPELKMGQKVLLTSDTFPGKKFMGTITTINPGVDVNTRNIEVEATIANPLHELSPGMFATVTVTTGTPKSYLTLPQTAITFNPYGDLVYLVKEDGKDSNNQPILRAFQAFVITGQTRGDQITIVKGLKEGETVVTSGQLKLKNKSLISINNSTTPAYEAAPSLSNDH